MHPDARATPTEPMSIVQKLSHSLNDIGRLANYLSGEGLHLLGGNRFQIVPAFLNFGDEFWIFESVSDAFAIVRARSAAIAGGATIGRPKASAEKITVAKRLCDSGVLYFSISSKSVGTSPSLTSRFLPV